MATKGPLDERLGLIILAQDQSSKFIFAEIYNIILLYTIMLIEHGTIMLINFHVDYP